MTNKRITLKNTSQVKSYSASYKSGKEIRHVIKHSEGWAVKKPGAQRVSGLYGTQSEAIESAREQAKSEGTAVVVHGRNGRIREITRY